MTDILMPQRLQWSHRITTTSLLLLVVIFTWLNLQQDSGSWIRWAVQCLPLLMFLPGVVINRYHRVYSWLCFVVVLYMIPAITQVVMSLGFRGAETPDSHWTDWLILLLVFTLFFGATFTSRWLQRWQWENWQARVANEQE